MFNRFCLELRKCRPLRHFLGSLEQRINALRRQTELRANGLPTITALSPALLRRCVEERLIGEELDVKLVLERAAQLACGVCAPDADQVIWLGTWPRC
jgi:hypothetical protein